MKKNFLDHLNGRRVTCVMYIMNVLDQAQILYCVKVYHQIVIYNLLYPNTLAVMKNKYTKPITEVYNLRRVSILTTSTYSQTTCDELCKFWHICRDRNLYKPCSDKEYR
jgi:hypothetical protein